MITLNFYYYFGKNMVSMKRRITLHHDIQYDAFNFQNTKPRGKISRIILKVERLVLLCLITFKTQERDNFQR